MFTFKIAFSGISKLSSFDPPPEKIPTTIKSKIINTNVLLVKTNVASKKTPNFLNIFFMFRLSLY